MRYYLPPMVLLAASAAAQDARIDVPAFVLPASNQLSSQARSILERMKQAAAPPEIAGDIARQRAFYQHWNEARLTEMRRHYKTVEHHQAIAGVGVDIVDPADGVPARNTARILINIHGGAFMWGAGSGALVEAIPIAATMGVRVVTVDYRLAPENRYPAASEDVTAVYRALLRRYRPENIGLYGCSAGGIIVAQSVAWIASKALPRPGAIGTFCGTGAPFSGDAPYLAGPITGGKPVQTPTLPSVLAFSYMAGVPNSDARAYPLTDPQTVRAMPPTLLLAGGRDFAASALTLAHRRLTAAGVDSDLQLFDGLPHAFFMWPDMPESEEAYAIIGRFFDRHLGYRARLRSARPASIAGPAQTAPAR